MSQTNNPSGKVTPPSLSEMMSQYVQRRASAEAAGIARAESGEVVPFEAAPVQPVDPRLAWNESLAVTRTLCPEVETHSWKAPPDWPALVGSHEPATAIAFCLGNFPQLVRDLHGLLQASDLTALRPSQSRPLPAPALLERAAQARDARSTPEVLLLVASLRLARHFDQAEQLLEKHFPHLPEDCQALAVNEKAALAWHQGQFEKAVALWKSQLASAPVLFNLGMAALFAENRSEGQALLAQAVAQLPEDSAWHHLGRLYLTLSEMRA